MKVEIELAADGGFRLHLQDRATTQYIPCDDKTGSMLRAVLTHLEAGDFRPASKPNLPAVLKKWRDEGNTVDDLPKYDISGLDAALQEALDKIVF